MDIPGPTDGTNFSLEDLARSAAARGNEAFAEFYKDLNKAEQAMLAQNVQLTAELAATMNANPIEQLYRDPDADAAIAFHKLVSKTEKDFGPIRSKAIFIKWIGILKHKLDREAEMRLRLLEPGISVRGLSIKVAKENEDLREDERRGKSWYSTDPEDIRRMLSKLRRKDSGPKGV